VQAQQGDVDADDPGNPAGAIPEGSETAEEGSPAVGVGIPADGDLSAAKGYWQRLDVRPGLSGEWQVNGRSQVLDFEDVIRLDLRYQENWSLAYDLQLIVRTFTVIFSKGSGAA
jgi:hypothetical protein